MKNRLCVTLIIALYLATAAPIINAAKRLSIKNQSEKPQRGNNWGQQSYFVRDVEQYDPSSMREMSPSGRSSGGSDANVDNLSDAENRRGRNNEPSFANPGDALKPPQTKSAVKRKKQKAKQVQREIEEIEKNTKAKQLQREIQEIENDTDAFLANFNAETDRSLGISNLRQSRITQRNNKRGIRKKPFLQETTKKTPHTPGMGWTWLETDSVSPVNTKSSARLTPGHGSATSNKKAESEVALKWLASLHPTIITEIKSNTRQKYPGDAEKQLYDVKYLYENDRALYDATSVSAFAQEAYNANPSPENKRIFFDAENELKKIQVEYIKELPQATKNSPIVSKTTLTEKGTASLAQFKDQHFQSILPLSKSALSEPQFNNTNCHSCNKKLTTFKKCSKCQNAYYCDRDCQVKDWKDGHKKQCQSSCDKTQKLIAEQKLIAKQIVRLQQEESTPRALKNQSPSSAPVLPEESDSEEDVLELQQRLNSQSNELVKAWHTLQATPDSDKCFRRFKKLYVEQGYRLSGPDEIFKNNFNTFIKENDYLALERDPAVDRQAPRPTASPPPKAPQKDLFADVRKKEKEKKEENSTQLVAAMQQLEAEPKNSPRHAIYFEKFRTLFNRDYGLAGTDVERYTSLLNSLIEKYKLGHNAWKPERVKQSSAADRTLAKPKKNKPKQGNGNPPVGRIKGAPKPTIQKQVLKAMIEKTTPKKPKPERLPSEPPMTPAQRKLWSRDVEQLAPPAPAPFPLIPEPKAPGEDETKEFAALNAQESAPIVTKSYSIPYGDGFIIRKGHAEKHHCPNDPRYEKLDPEYKHPNGCYKIDDTTFYPCHLSKAQLLENIGYAIRHGTPYIDSDLRTKILGQFPPNDTGHPIYILAVTEQNPETGQNEILTDFSISKRTYTRKSLESQNVHEQHERGLLAKRWQQEKQRKKKLRLITLQQQKELRLETRRQAKLHQAALQLQHEPQELQSEKSTGQAPLPAQEETFQPWVWGVGPQGNVLSLDFQH